MISSDCVTFKIPRKSPTIRSTLRIVCLNRLNCRKKKRNRKKFNSMAEVKKRTCRPTSLETYYVRLVRKSRKIGRFSKAASFKSGKKSVNAIGKFQFCVDFFSFVLARHANSSLRRTH